MIAFIDNQLNKITMYRLIEYYLGGLIGVGLVFSATKILPYDPFALAFTTAFFIVVCWGSNTIFAHILKVPTNLESSYISALILALIVTPIGSSRELLPLAWIGVWAMASKYIFAIKGKHIFNPVAFAVALTALTINQTASWWVGNTPMLPFVLVGGVLIVRKIRRWDLVFSFLGVAVATILSLTVMQGGNMLRALQDTALASPLFFFAFVILTEPLTTPPTQPLQLVYGAMVGVLFAPQLHFGGFYMTPELAMLAGNLFSYLVSPKAKLMLQLKEKIRIGPDLYDFIFVPKKRLSYAPGQYMEWTLGHADPDNRGNRRYFTLASSPTEPNLRLGIKFYPNSSSYKRSMLAMDRDTEIMAAQLAGDFTLPRNPRQKCVFIAGGIGITPFRSMIKFLIDTGQRRPVVLFYSNRTANEILYADVFNQAQQIGIKTVYTLTDATKAPSTWKGYTGHISERMIQHEVPDYRRCVFYLSGPNSMVNAFEHTLLRMGVHRSHIKKDFFPGFA